MLPCLLTGMIKPKYYLKKTPTISRQTNKQTQKGRQTKEEGNNNNNEKSILAGMHLQELEFFISPPGKKLYYAILSLPFS